MNTLNRDYDDVLRRALHAAAETVEPSADGLERIRARLGRPPLLSFASVAAWYSEAAMRIVAWAAPLIRLALDTFWSVVGRFRPAEREPGQPGPRFGWVRPMAAMGTAIFVAAAGTFAIMSIPHGITSGNSGFESILPWTHPTSSDGGASTSRLNGGATQLPGPSAAPTGPGGILPVVSPASSACSSLGNSRTGSASPAPSVSPSASAPASSSPPASVSPSVTPAPPTTAPASSAPPTSISTTPDPGAASTASPSAGGVVSSGVVSGGVVSGGVASGSASEPHSALMVPPSSASATPKSPCPPGSVKKKKKKTTAPLAAGGLTARRVTLSGVKD